MSPRPLLTLRLGIALAALLGVLGAVPGASGASAQAAPATAPTVEWSQTSLTGPVRRLYTPTSGAFFAQTADGVARSDDGGATWQPVPLPAPPVDRTGAVVVDPTNHATIYLATKVGIYKTVDDAQSWSLLAPADPKYSTFQALAVSPVDPNVIYMLATTQNGEGIRFTRSKDGGQTWDEPDTFLKNSQGRVTMACWWSVHLLQPHATDPNGLYRAFACESRGIFVTLRRSIDGGATWRELIQPPQAATGWLVGGLPDAPTRLTMAANKSPLIGGYLIARSDDDGGSWTTLEEHKEGRQPGPGTSVTVGGLAIDPTRSDRLLLGVNAVGTSGPAPLRLSDDGGSTWTDVTPPDLPKITDVKFGIDGRTMFVATESGLWRSTSRE